MFRKFKVPAIALIFALTGPAVHADDSTDNFDKLMGVSGVSQSIESMAQVISSEMGEEKLTAEIGDPRIASVMSHSLQSSMTPELFERTITESLKERLGQSEISGLLAWYETPVGKRVAAAHQVDQWAIQQRVSSGERPQLSAERRVLIEKLDQVVMGSDNAFELALDTAAVMGHSMMSSQGMSLPLAEVRQMVAMQMQAEQANIVDEYQASLGFLYESLSDGDLEEMIAYSFQPEVTVFCDAMWNGLRSAFHQGGAALGVALVAEMQGSI